MPTQEDIERVIAETVAQQEARREKAADPLDTATELPSITANFVAHPAKLVREYVRSVLAPNLLLRMYKTAMGTQKFDTPTAIGRVVQVEAPPAVQMATARALVQIGIPMQLGVTDDDGRTLPGVIALGTLDLDAARQESHGDRYVSAEEHARLVAGHMAMAPSASPNGEQGHATGKDGGGWVSSEGHATGNGGKLRPMSERIAAGEFEIAEVEEGVGTVARSSEDAAPGPLPGPTIEQKLLANRRARRASQPLPYPDLRLDA